MRWMLPTIPLFIGVSTWMSETGSSAKVPGIRRATSSRIVSTTFSGDFRSIKKKSLFSLGCWMRGIMPRLIRWALVTIRLCLAWRKISNSLATGTRPESMMSFSTQPAPTREAG